ncbi:MAG: Gfo/Idh/MocA family oxidoreductase [Gammaproteobacteria bacterium]|nr:Gfo/Idh/MocA family oxidoreductase [Gammaproteobacteria bacterium]
MSLRVLVLGAGFAGQGHVESLRTAGVTVIGIVSRTKDVVEGIATKLEIPYAGTDWQSALEELKPDILAVGTPGGAHHEPVIAAIEAGCHIYCDKPLAATSRQAREMAQAATSKSIKTAYAASYRYQPYALYARELIADGAIGEPLEVECSSHFNLNPLLPFGWSHRIEEGGGRLNNNFTHKLAIVEHVLDGQAISVCGEARNDMPRAPIVPGVHDFRDRAKFIPLDAEDRKLEWAEANSEWSYTVLAHIQPGFPVAQPVSASFRHSALQPRFDHDYIAFYGSRGAIYIQGHYAQGPLFLRKSQRDWEELPVPNHITDSLPNIEDDTQRNWTQLAIEFVHDIQGKGYSGYQTFKEGWIYQEMIDHIRDGDGWLNVKDLSI